MNESWDVLVVDDEPVVGDAIRLVLGHEGLRVACTADAEAGLAHPALATCRLALVDVMLPGRSGFDLLPLLRERRPDLPIVLITGYATPAIAERTHQAGATAFLPKPFDETELLDLVRRVLGTPDVAREEIRP
jgi:DNA-binding NtrC family response regulator